MTPPAADLPAQRPSRLATFAIAGALSLFALALAWTILQPRFLPSETWIRGADLPSLGLGLLLGLVGVVAFANAARGAGASPRFGRPQSASDVVVLILVVALTTWATRVVVLEIVPYAASRGSETRLTETRRIISRADGARGPGTWRFESTGWYRFSIRVPRDPAADQGTFRALVDCPSAGSRVRLIGTGNGFGLHYGRMAITDAETREMLLIDFDEGTSRVPQRC